MVSQRLFPAHARDRKKPDTSLRPLANTNVESSIDTAYADGERRSPPRRPRAARLTSADSCFALSRCTEENSGVFSRFLRVSGLWKAIERVGREKQRDCARRVRALERDIVTRTQTPVSHTHSVAETQLEFSHSPCRTRRRRRARRRRAAGRPRTARRRCARRRSRLASPGPRPPTAARPRHTASAPPRRTRPARAYIQCRYVRETRVYLRDVSCLRFGPSGVPNALEHRSRGFDSTRSIVTKPRQPVSNHSVKIQK